jgi:hypothetical protein
MQIIIKRKHYSRWGVDGECFIKDKKVCDTVEHPTAYKPPGIYQLNSRSFWHYFLRGNGPMKSVRGEISLGVYKLPGLVLHAAQMHQRMRHRIHKALKRKENIELIIQN